MTEVKQHGRRSAAGPSTHAPAQQPLSRRDALAAERAAAGRAAVGPGSLAELVRNGAGQKVGLALAATGLVLAVAAPVAGGASGGGEPQLAAAVQPRVTAAADAPISFAGLEVHSTLNPDAEMKQTLKVSASHVSAQAAKGTLSAPLKVMEKSSPFGSRLNPLTGEKGEFHRGEDFSVTCGTDVFAAAGGTVTFAGWHQYGGGNRIVISHGNGLSTTYNHLSSLGVKVGQKVERGDKIALSGTTGNSTGCHLHFEVMVDDEVVDPEGWL